MGFTDLGFARLDTDRAARTGDPEVIYGAGKTVEEAVALVGALRTAHPDRAALLTRADEQMLQGVVDRYGPEAHLDAQARAVVVGPLPPPRGMVRVVSAGTSDGPVAAEAALTAAVFGAGVERISDVGVAGIHRLLAVRDRLVTADCLIVVAGMDGALPSAIGGLVGVPVVAVPTSVGYGASFGGVSALLAMLNSCAPGVVVCNIDNGFGAGVFAARVARRSLGATPPLAASTGESGESGESVARSTPAASATQPATVEVPPTQSPSAPAAPATVRTPAAPAGHHLPN